MNFRKTHVSNIATFVLFFVYFIFASLQYKMDNEEAIRPLFTASFIFLPLFAVIYLAKNNLTRLLTGSVTTPVNLLILTFFLFSIFSGKLYYERSYIDAIYSAALWYGLYFAIGAYLLQKPNMAIARLDVIFYTVIIFAFVASMVAMFAFVGFSIEFGTFKIEQTLWTFPRIHGFMGEPTSLGALLGYALLLQWHFNQRQHKSFLFIIVALFIGIGLIWSGSRNAIISLVLSIAYYQLATGNVREIAKLVKRIIIFLIFILFIAMVVISDHSELASTVIDALDRQDYDGDNENSRLLIWGNTLRLLGESQLHEIIIGHGNGALRNAYRAAFNSPLEIMFDYGLAGLMIFLCWTFAMLASSFKRSRTSMSNISALAGAFVVYGFMFNLFISWFPSPNFNFSVFSFGMGAILIFILNRIEVDCHKAHKDRGIRCPARRINNEASPIILRLHNNYQI